MMRDVVTQWRTAFDEVVTHWRPLLIFQLWFALVAGLLLTPAFGWVLEQIIRSSGRVAINNYDLAEFFLSVRGLVFLAASFALGLAIFFVEAAGLIVLCAELRSGSATPTAALWHGLRALPALARLSLWVGGILGVLGVPFLLLGAGIAIALLGAHDINYYLYFEPAEWRLAVVLGTVLAVVYGLTVATLALRFVFALPLLVFERRPPRSALRGSWQLTRHRALRLLIVVGGWWALLGLAANALALVVTMAGLWLLDAAASSPTLALAAAGSAFALLMVIGAAWAVIASSGMSILIVRAFGSAGGRLPAGSLERIAGGRETRRLPSARRVGAVLALAFLGSLAYAGVHLYGMQLEENFAVTAHRAGAIHAPENTLAALKRAIADGADYAEIDVQTTRDGAVVVIHDGDLQRVANDPRTVAQLTFAELRTLDVGSWNDPAFAEERVPLLTEMIELARDRIKLNIELKYNRIDPSLAPKVVDILQSEAFANQCVITSLEEKALVEVETLDPALTTGLIVTQALGDPALEPTDFLAVSQGLATEAFISRAREESKPVHVWTVNDVEGMQRAVERGAANLITDRPAEAVALRTRRAQMSVPERLALRLRSLLVD